MYSHSLSQQPQGQKLGKMLVQLAIIDPTLSGGHLSTNSISLWHRHVCTYVPALTVQGVGRAT
jgi:hypothetical protein